jgi:hypothetical protein
MMSAGAAKTATNGNESERAVRAWRPSGIQVDLFQPTTANWCETELGIEGSNGTCSCEGSQVSGCILRGSFWT